MTSSWKTTRLESVEEVQQELLSLHGKRWLCRGQSKPYGTLVPSIDRNPREHLARAEKLTLERKAINLFRSTARFFADPGEKGALDDDIVALMVLRHYGVPTRLLDWSRSPWVATYFAVEHHDSDDGEIWAFDESLYEHNGREQWRRWPECTSDGSGEPSMFAASVTAFRLDTPPNWFICGFYYQGFHRQSAQEGVYTMTAQFARSHDVAITEILANSAHHHRYVIAANLKQELREDLRNNHGIWRGALFPDSAGAAETANAVFASDG